MENTIVRSTDPRRAVGSPADIDQEIKRLQDRKVELDKQQRKEAAEAKAYAEEKQRAGEKAHVELIAEVKSQIKACPGTVTATPCPACIGQAGTISRTLRLTMPGGMIEPVTVSLGSPIFFLRQQKDGTLLCPRCGFAAHAF